MFINGVKMKSDFYEQSKSYWCKISPTVDGMLGGFAYISKTDIKGSMRFLEEHMSPIDDNTPFRRALDCGAGIGRITKNLLLNFCHVVDLLEFNQCFLDESRNFIGKSIFDKRIGNTYCSSIHQFEPQKDIKYDLIWCQWVTGHLTDDHFVSFLKLCQTILSPNGLIVIKDNHTSSDDVDDDTIDSSVTRPYWLLKEIFEKSGLKIISERRQYKFPKGLYPVKMFALR